MPWVLAESGHKKAAARRVGWGTVWIRRARGNGRASLRASGQLKQPAHNQWGRSAARRHRACTTCLVLPASVQGVFNLGESADNFRECGFEFRQRLCSRLHDEDSAVQSTEHAFGFRKRNWCDPTPVSGKKRTR